MSNTENSRNEIAGAFSSNVPSELRLWPRMFPADLYAEMDAPLWFDERRTTRGPQKHALRNEHSLIVFPGQKIDKCCSTKQLLLDRARVDVFRCREQRTHNHWSDWSGGIRPPTGCSPCFCFVCYPLAQFHRKAAKPVEKSKPWWN